MIEQVLARARSRIARYTPDEAAAADVLLVDLRCRESRERDGIIPGSVHVPRSVLEWRCDPDSPWPNPVVADRSLRLVLLCEHGYSSSLAAASLVDVGFERAGDLAGGFEAWRDAGLPVVAPPPPGDGLPGMGGPES